MSHDDERKLEDSCNKLIIGGTYVDKHNEAFLHSCISLQ